MKRKTPNPVVLLILVFASIACAILQPASAASPEPTATGTPTPTNTARPSPTLRPTQTPDIAATQHAEELLAEVQRYFDKGYLTTLSGTFTEISDFSYDWAHLGGYQPLVMIDTVSDFFISAHFKWNSAYQNSDTSGCGFIFAMQPNKDHYAVFLDRTKIDFRTTNTSLGYSTRVKPMRGTGQVKFDYPAEADFTLIVKDAYAYVLVNGEVVGEYALSNSREMHGGLGLTVLSGTNKDYGTHCEMSNLHLWTPKE